MRKALRAHAAARVPVGVGPPPTWSKTSATSSTSGRRSRYRSSASAWATTSGGGRIAYGVAISRAIRTPTLIGSHSPMVDGKVTVTLPMPLPHERVPP